jgi:hypothetical protein
MKYLLFIGCLFISACIGVSKAMTKQTQAEFLVMNFLIDSLNRRGDWDNVKFSKLDTNKNLSVIQYYLLTIKPEYWVSCTYQTRNGVHIALFGMDTTLKKIDTVIVRNKY